jgi:heat shock protein HtpX
LLPGSITYLDLMARNRRTSALLVAGMVVLAVAVGSALSALASGGAPGPALVRGAAIGAALAILASLWSWYGGASAILAISGARPLAKRDDPELFNVVDELRIAAGLPMPRVYLIEDSAQNAFASGRDPAHAVVAITRGLREKLTRDELQGVLAHEMAHVRHLDIRFAMLMATLAGGIAFACDAALRGLRHSRASRGRGGANPILLVVVLLLAILAPLAARFVQMAYSRQREYLADAGAVELTRNPDGLASALRKLARDAEPLVESANRGTAHLYIVNPLERVRRTHHELDSPLSSHPPIQKRIARLEALTR